jgi:hypothetical protein
MRVTNTRVNQLWEVMWARRDGINVPEEEWLWVLARTAVSAAHKAGAFLKRKNGRAKVTGITESGTIDIF